MDRVCVTPSAINVPEEGKAISTTPTSTTCKHQHSAAKTSETISLNSVHLDVKEFYIGNEYTDFDRKLHKHFGIKYVKVVSRDGIAYFIYANVIGNVIARLELYA